MVLGVRMNRIITTAVILTFSLSLITGGMLGGLEALAQANIKAVHTSSGDNLKSKIYFNKYKRHAVVGMFNQFMVDEFKRAVKGLKATDTLHLTIRSSGGYVPAMKQIIKEIIKTDARIIMEVRGFAYSAAASILCFADAVLIDPTDTVMFHLPYYDVPGKGPMPITEKTARTFQDKMLVRSFIRMVKNCSPVFPQNKLEKFKSGQDVWLRSRTIIWGDLNR